MTTLNHIDRMKRRLLARSRMVWTKPVPKETKEERKRRNKGVFNFLERLAIQTGMRPDGV